MHRHIVAVMHCVVISVIMDWSIWSMKTKHQRLPLPGGWWGWRIFQWWSQNSGWEPMPTLKNNSSGCPADFTANICANRCSPMLEWTWLCHPLGPETTLTQMRPGGRTHCHGTHLPQLHPRRYETCTKRYASSWGYPEEAGVRRLLRSTSTRTSLIPSRNASGLSSCPPSQRENADRCWPMSLSLIPIQSLLQLTATCMWSSLQWKRLCVRGCWP